MPSAGFSSRFSFYRFPPPSKRETLAGLLRELVTFGETEDYCVLIGELSTGLPTQTNAGNVVWPNPAGTWVEWRIGEPVTSVDVFDLTGRKLRPNIHHSGTDGVRIEVGQLANGEYMLRAVLRNGSYMQRVVVQH